MAIRGQDFVCNVTGSFAGGMEVWEARGWLYAQLPRLQIRVRENNKADLFSLLRSSQGRGGL